MFRFVLLAPVLLAACATPQQQAATCYRIVENVVTEEGGRALMQVPCPEGQSGILSSQQAAMLPSLGAPEQAVVNGRSAILTLSGALPLDRAQRPSSLDTCRTLGQLQQRPPDRPKRQPG
jgi:hypothetical protein